MKTQKYIAWIALVVFVSIAPLAAQSREALRKNSAAIKDSLSPLTKNLEKSVVELHDANQFLVFGTVVTSDGLIVTKASEIKGKKIVCHLPGDRRFEPTVLAEDESMDLALLKVAANDLSPIDLTWNEIPTSGSLVISVGKAGNPIGFGVVEVDPRRFRMRQQRDNNRSYLGVVCSEIDDAVGIRVDEVTDDSAARKAGIRKDDVIKSIDGESIKEVDELVQALRAYTPGETVEIVLVRGELEMTVRAKLGSYPSRDPNDQWGGGPFSKQRYGFNAVIAHDTVIQPGQCGSPVIDMDGHVVGINIARALRVVSYSLPIGQVSDFVKANQSAVTRVDASN